MKVMFRLDRYEIVFGILYEEKYTIITQFIYMLLKVRYHTNIR